VGHLTWCYNGSKVQSGSYWSDVYRSGFWFFEGVVHSVNHGCFGGCDRVYRERLGSFIFNPPWPTWTTHLQPWHKPNGTKTGSSWTAAGG
jgi:hypothetical protein